MPRRPRFQGWEADTEVPWLLRLGQFLSSAGESVGEYQDTQTTQFKEQRSLLQDLLGQEEKKAEQQFKLADLTRKQKLEDITLGFKTEEEKRAAAKAQREVEEEARKQGVAKNLLKTITEGVPAPQPKGVTFPADQFGPGYDLAPGDIQAAQTAAVRTQGGYMPPAAPTGQAATAGQVLQAYLRAGQMPPDAVILEALKGEKTPEGFSLGEGQARYGPTGKLIVERPKEPKETKAASLGAEMTAALREGGVDPETATPADIARARRLIQTGRIEISAAQGREAARAPYEPMTPGGLPGAPPVTPSAAPSVPGAPTGVSAPRPGESAFQYRTRVEAEQKAKEPTAAEKTRAQTGQSLEGIITRLEGLIDEGAFKNVGTGLTGRVTGAIQSNKAMLEQSNKAQVLYESLKEGILANPVRFFGDVGALAEGDIKRARALFGSTTGFPDTEATARGKLRQLRELIAEIKARPENQRLGAGLTPPTGSTGMTITLPNGKTVTVE